ncbi:MAG: alpha-1,2-fucosyltransferase [Bacteroidota bacterium]
MPLKQNKLGTAEHFKFYAYPKFKSRYGDYFFFRLTGSGLGNNLFVWAKFKVFVKEFGAIPISPTWLQLNITKNKYFLEHLKRHNIGLFKKDKKSISGLMKLIIMLCKPKINRNSFEESISKNRNLNRRFQNHVVLVSGMDDHFEYISKEHHFIKNELLAIVKEKHKKALEFDFSRSISAHVRLGDFGQATNVKDIKLNNMRLGISWYVQMINQIRSRLDKKFKVFIFSDGTDYELKELLGLENVKRLDFGSPIGDMIGLSQSNLLITSGSTYSMWASYLGRMPVVWHSGKLLQKLYYENPEYEMECDVYGKLSEAQIELINNYINIT